MAAQGCGNSGWARMNKIDSTQTPRESAVSLERLLAESSMLALNAVALGAFDSYLALIQRWNARTNLTAIRDADGILRRHFLESIFCAQALPPGIGTLLDFGSGAGFPGIPIAICRPEIKVALAESQNKKAAFLREVVSVLGLKARIIAGRAETLLEDFDCVTMRAVDRMEQAVLQATSLVRCNGLLALLTTTAEYSALEGLLSGVEWQDPISLPGSDQRVLCLGTKLAA